MSKKSARGEAISAGWCGVEAIDEKGEVAADQEDGADVEGVSSCVPRSLRLSESSRLTKKMVRCGRSAQQHAASRLTRKMVRHGRCLFARRQSIVYCVAAGQDGAVWKMPKPGTEPSVTRKMVRYGRSHSVALPQELIWCGMEGI
jgi:hypothetical protein